MRRDSREPRGASGRLMRGRLKAKKEPAALAESCCSIGLSIRLNLPLFAGHFTPTLEKDQGTAGLHPKNDTSTRFEIHKLSLEPMRNQVCTCVAEWRLFEV